MSSISRRRPAWLLTAVATALLFSCGGGREGRPDVVVILIDTLRPDYLGFYGHERETAMFLASLAERSAGVGSLQA